MQEYTKISPELSFAILCLIPEQLRWWCVRCLSGQFIQLPVWSTALFHWQCIVLSIYFCPGHTLYCDELNNSQTFDKFPEKEWYEYQPNRFQSFRDDSSVLQWLHKYHVSVAEFWPSFRVSQMQPLLSPYDKLELHLHEPWKSKIGSTPSGGRCYM